MYTEQNAEADGYNIKDVPEARRALVLHWAEKVKSTRDSEPVRKAFAQMRENKDFAARGCDKKWEADGKYTVPITNRLINLSVSSLYAKNPTVVAKRKRTMQFKLWDGRADTLQMAMEGAQFGDPMAVLVLQEIAEARANELMLDRLGKTLEIVWDYYVNEQQANFKQQLKAAVRRAKVCKVAYVKLGYQRMLQPKPEVAAGIADVTSKMVTIEGLLAKIADGNLQEQTKEYEDLRLQLQELQSQPEIIAREGPVFDFPRSDEITIDPRCRHLKTLAGARWASQLYEMHPDDVQEIYGVKVGSNYTRYDQDGKAYHPNDNTKTENACARVHEIWDHKGRQWLTICEGYPDFLREPAEPDIKLERFWPIFPIVFNETESDDLYPPSEVELAKHIQNEYNRSREALRQHRNAARPYWVASSRVEEADLKKLQNHADHEIIKIPTVAAGEKVEDYLQRGPTSPIDPNLYEVEMNFADFQRVTGIQEANLGGVSGGTATESSIAEQSRTVSQADNVDDLDEMLTELAKGFGQVCLTELSKETVVEIAGPGAVWPDMPQSREEAAKDLLLEIKAGSSGRPNRAAELANLERATPILVQVPGFRTEPIARRLANLLDFDPEEAIAEGMPSIMAINAIISKAAQGGGASPGGEPTGDPVSDPASQGGAGGQNAPGPAGSTPGAQPAFPAPAPGFA